MVEAREPSNEEPRVEEPRAAAPIAISIALGAVLPFALVPGWLLADDLAGARAGARVAAFAALTIGFALGCLPALSRPRSTPLGLATFALLVGLVPAIHPPFSALAASHPALRPVAIVAFVAPPAFALGVSRRAFAQAPILTALSASLGVIASSYFALPDLSVRGTMLIASAVLLGLAVATVARESSSRTSLALAAPTLPSLFTSGAAAAVAASLAIYALHLARTSIGVTVFTPHLVVAALLVSIGAGAALANVGRARLRDHHALVAAALLFAALATALSLLVWDRFGAFVAATSPKRASVPFFARELVRLAFLFSTTGPTALALGFALRRFTLPTEPTEPAAPSRAAFTAALALGAGFGASIATALLIGRVSADTALRGHAFVFAALAFAPLSARPLRGAWLTAAALPLALVLLLPKLTTSRLTAGSHYLWQARSQHRRVLELREDLHAGFVSVSKTRSGAKVLEVDGKPLGSDRRADFQDRLALIAGLHTTSFDRAAVLGLGTGRVLRTLHAMDFEQIDVVEPSDATVALGRKHFKTFLERPLADTRHVSLTVDDPRDFLAASSRSYNTVVLSTEGLAFASSGRAFSRELFAVVHDHLAAGGVLVAWLQLHHVDPSDLRSVVFTGRSVFKHARLYADDAHRQGFLVLCDAALDVDYGAARVLEGAPDLRKVLHDEHLESLRRLEDELLLGTDIDVDRFLGSAKLEPPRLFTDLGVRVSFFSPSAVAEKPIHIERLLER